MKKSKRSKKSNSWKIKQHRDQFFKKSKTLGYRSRASFKLIELNQKFKFIKKNSRLLDLGSYPGGWSQVASKLITNGKILAIDIKSMEQIKSVKFLKYDILKQDIKEKIENIFQFLLLNNFYFLRLILSFPTQTNYFLFSFLVPRFEVPMQYCYATNMLLHLSTNDL